ncbi:hypothetical protein Tco_1308021 [Tanacetum coccineum]
MLKVSPWKGVVRFGKKGKLAPRFVGPFEILKGIGPVAYRFRLPEELSSVHDTFHVSNLKKCLANANLHVPLDEIKVDKMETDIQKRTKNKAKTIKLSTEWKSVKRRSQIKAKSQSSQKVKLSKSSQPRQSQVNFEKLNQRRI